jgi:hypothetical protein
VTTAAIHPVQYRCAASTFGQRAEPGILALVRLASRPARPRPLSRALPMDVLEPPAGARPDLSLAALLSRPLAVAWATPAATRRSIGEPDTDAPRAMPLPWARFEGVAAVRARAVHVPTSVAPEASATHLAGCLGASRLRGIYRVAGASLRVKPAARFFVWGLHHGGGAPALSRKSIPRYLPGGRFDGEGSPGDRPSA